MFLVEKCELKGRDNLPLLYTLFVTYCKMGKSDWINLKSLTYFLC
jgi:hypothetical protein